MKKNYSKHGPTGILWALYLIVGIVAFLVSNLYFKFEFKDAIIFGAVNLVVVIAITEGIDLIFKKAKLRQERKAAEETPGDESVTDSENTGGTEDETAKDSLKEDAATEPEKNDDSVDEVPSDKPPVAAVEEPVEIPLLITGRPGKGVGYFGRLKRPVAKSIVEPVEVDSQETVDAPADSAPILITGTPGSGKNWDVLSLAALKNAESAVSETEDATEDSLPSGNSETLTGHDKEISSKPRGRRANPEAVIDAPTSSIPVITPDMIKPRVEPVAETPVVETPVEEKVPTAPVVEEPIAKPVAEPVAEENYLSAEEFLATTKLTSPRAIVREYQRLGGKDDIFNILMARQK